MYHYSPVIPLRVDAETMVIFQGIAETGEGDDAENAQELRSSSEFLPHVSVPHCAHTTVLPPVVLCGKRTAESSLRFGRF